MFRAKKFRKLYGINHCFFTRNGGFSKGIYRSLNCGKGSADVKTNVKKNLNFVSKKMKINKGKLFLMHQTHSNKVLFVKDKNKKINSDAIITNIKGFALGVVTADCVPILLYDLNNKVIGCVHAGWKGAFKGIIENTIKRFKKLNKNNNIFAAVGPCIGKNSYEVDLKFYRKFISISKNNHIYFLKKNKTKKLFNIRKYVSDKLMKLGVKVDHVDKDTYKDKTRFFSYRRSKILGENDYGRCISVICLTKFSQN